jgi:hypothetical protein
LRTEWLIQFRMVRIRTKITPEETREIAKTGGLKTGPVPLQVLARLLEGAGTRFLRALAAEVLRQQTAV